MSDVELSDISLALPGGGEVEAYSVGPRDQDPRGGVLFLHWFDPEAPDGNRTQFLPEAQQFAGDGFLSLLPELQFPWHADPVGSAADIARVEDELGRLAACVDLLEARGARRIVMVGHDFGAMHGALLMAREERILAGVLIAAANRWADWSLRFWPIGEDRIDYQRAMRPLDPIEHIGAIGPRPLLMQFAECDFFIAAMDANELYNAAAEPKRLERYDTDHALRDERARADRGDFVLSAIGA
jgi:pimeloyl-ACP methyl ester carboxylesterase